MLIIQETHQDINLIKLLIGSETQLSMAVNGMLILNLLPIMATCDSNKPIILGLNLIGNEQDLYNELKESGMQPPFAPPMGIITDKEIKSDIIPTNNITQNNLTNKVNQNSKLNSYGEMTFKIGECSECGEKNVKVLLAGKFRLCENCVKIAAGLASTKKTDNIIITDAVKVDKKKIKKDQV